MDWKLARSLGTMESLGKLVNPIYLLWKAADRFLGINEAPTPKNWAPGGVWPAREPGDTVPRLLAFRQQISAPSELSRDLEDHPAQEKLINPPG